MDTSSVLDLEAYGLIKRLRKVKIVIVQEVFNEIRDRNLKRRLARIVTDRGPQKRAAFIPNLYSLDYGERAIITAIVCEQRRRKRRRIYVSNDGAYTYPTMPLRWNLSVLDPTVFVRVEWTRLNLS